MSDVIKTLVIEFFQATGFALCIGFLISAFGENSLSVDAAGLALFLGAVPLMLAKRFILSFIKSCREL